MSDDASGRDPSDRHPPGVRERIRYRFDNLLARGTSATLIWLGIVTAAAVLISGLVLLIGGVSLAGSESGSWLEDLWQSLLRVLDTGTMAADVGWGRRLLALAITIFGLLVAGTLIGIIAAGVEDRIDHMRRGRSVVIESDHVVVLGASDRLPVLLQQLVLANDGAHRGRTIVVLADLDPAEIHAAAQGAADPSGRTKIVYRSGDPTDLNDLALARLPTARAAIVLSDRRSDRAAMETVLAIAAELGGLDRLTVAVELLDETDMFRLRRAFGESVQPIVTEDAVARTVAFALRQRGLSRVVDELLDFRGSDLHVIESSRAVGATFGQLVHSWTNARPIGLFRADGEIELNPALDSVVSETDRIIVIADDVRAIQISQPASGPADAADEPADRTGRFVAGPVQERLVLIGWNDLGARVLDGWSTSAAPTSTVDVVADRRWVDPDTVPLPDLGPIPVSYSTSDDVITAALDRRPTTVVVLGPADTDDEADISTLLDLNALHRELDARGLEPPRIVVELRDATHRSLVDLAGPDDLIISDAMGSQFIAQLADQPIRRQILLELYTARGATLRLVSCQDVGLAGERTVRDVVDRCAVLGLLVIGWRRAPGRGGKVTLNPDLLDRVALEADDELVVVG